MPRRRLLACVPPLALALALAAPASAQAPGLQAGVSKITTNGIGQVRIGMDPSQAREAAGVRLQRSEVGDCVYLVAGPPNTGQGPTLRFHEGVLRQVHVARKGFRTLKNVGVGTSVRKVRRRYGALSRRPNLGGGYDLIRRKGDGRLIFSIGGGKVQAIAGGHVPWVLQQECV